MTLDAKICPEPKTLIGFNWFIVDGINFILTI